MLNRGVNREAFARILHQVLTEKAEPSFHMKHIWGDVLHVESGLYPEISTPVLSTTALSCHHKAPSALKENLYCTVQYSAKPNQCLQTEH